MRRWLFLALAAALPAFLPAAAGAVDVSASIAPSEVAVGQTATYTISVSGAGGDVRPELPDLDGFDVAGSGTSESLSINNRHVSQRTDYNYYLVPQREGTFTLPPATVRADGKTYRTGTVDVKVVAAGSRSRPVPTPAPGLRVPQFPGLPQMPGMPDLKSLFGASRPLGEGDVRVHLSADRDDPYVGEQVILTFRFERAVNIMGPADYTDPPTPGFRAFPVEMPPGADRHAEVRDGRNWAIEERRTLLFPLSAGDRTVGPAAVEFAVDPFAGRQRVVTDSVTLHVKPLPEAGRPADFSGGVGTFKLEAALDRTGAAVGDTVTLTVTVSGQGNFHDMEPVRAPDAPGFEVFDPEVTEDLHNGPAGTAGARRYTFVLIPREAGKLQVGKVRLSTFDPGAGTYKTVEAGPFPLAAAALTAPAAAPQASPAAPETRIGRGEALAWAAVVFVAGIVMLLLRRMAGRKAETPVPEAETPRPDGSKARAALEAVLGPTEAGADNGWAADLDRALRGWLGARWDVPPPRVDGAAAARHLAGDPEAAGACQKVLAALQAARFAPASEIDREALAGQVRALVERLDGAGRPARVS